MDVHEVLTTSTELTRRVGEAAPGDNLRLEIIREGRRQTLNIRSGTRPADINAAQNPETEEPESAPGRPSAAAGQVVEGMTLAPLTDALRERYSIAETVRGLVITAATESSRAGRAGVQPGFVILQANGRQMATVADLQTVIREARAANRESILLLIRIPQGNRPFVLELSAAE